MEKHILQMLENNNRVIVPEFGAFIVKQRNPLTIIFNEFLQYNDGMLVDFLSKEQGLEREEAKTNIDEYVKKVNDIIDKEGSYPMQGIGQLVKNAAGKISIEQTADKKVTKDSNEIKKEKTADTKSAKSTPKVDKKIPQENQKTEPKKKEDNKPSGTKTNKSSSQPAKPLSESNSVEKEEGAKPKKTVIPSTPKNPTLRAEQSSPKRYNKGNKRQNTILWIIIIVIVNVVLIGYFIFSDKLSGLSRGDKPETDVLEVYTEDDETSTQKTETAGSDEDSEQVTTEETEITEPATQGNASISTTKYYVVAGVFREEQNADNLVTELVGKGYDSEKFGKIGNLHAVSYAVFSSKAEADKLLIKIQQSSDPEAWIRTVK